MRRVLSVILLGAFLSFPTLAQAGLGREQVDLDLGWKFQAGDAKDYQGAPEVTAWRWKFAMKTAPLGLRPADPSFSADGPDWADAAPAEDVFHSKGGSAWFRVTLPPAKGKTKAVSFSSVDDNATVFLNGQRLTYHSGWDDPFTVSLEKAWRAEGPNVLAVLVQNGSGPGGIGETRFISAGVESPLPPWRYRLVPGYSPSDLDLSGLQADPFGDDWKNARKDEDVFAETLGFALFQADLPEVPFSGRVLRFDAVDDNATVYLNGKELLHHEGWNEPFSVPLDKVWDPNGPNRLAVLVENSYGGGTIKNVTLEHSGVRPSGPVLPGYDDRSWQDVRLPHDFVVGGVFDPTKDKSHGYLPTGVGWYRKTFFLPEFDKDRSLWIDFDGVYRDSRVWLNGKELGRHSSGYTSFRYDLGEAAVYGGKNVLVVRADATGSEGWWYEGGGIYRHVRLHKAENLHVAPWGVFVSARPNQELSPSSASLRVETQVDNRSMSDQRFRLVSEVMNPSGQVVQTLTSDVKVSKSSQGAFAQSGRLDRPSLWDTETPSLYRLVTRLEVDGKTLDRVETTFGVRSIRFDAKEGFFLNGRSVKIKGTCNHQDFAGVGIALGDRLHAYRVGLLKGMGSNAYRCSHHPMASELLDECDRQGMLVMDENRRLGDTEDVLAQTRDMVLRDRNHPSVILWSLCNEESLQGTPEGAKRGKAMKKVILELDKTRLVTAAMNGGYGAGLTDVVDLLGFNYHDAEYEPFHKAHPDKRLIGSETASTVCTRGIYANDKVRGYVSAYDVNFPSWGQSTEKAWKALATRPYMAGGFVWTGFDYRGEPTPYAWPCISSHFGVFDTCGFPKDNYWYYKAWWGKDPVLHLLPHWNDPLPSAKSVSVWAHTNCDEVELFLNGKSQGRRKVEPLGHAEWDVVYRPGVLSAKGYKEGALVAEDKVETTGRPASLRLEPFVTAFKADGKDQVPVKVSVVDAKGRVVPTASNLVTFQVVGPAQVDGVGNGDPSCHESDKASQRSAFHGHCLAVLRAGKKAGTVTLRASSPGLRSATVTLTTAAP